MKFIKHRKKIKFGVAMIGDIRQRFITDGCSFFYADYPTQMWVVARDHDDIHKGWIVYQPESGLKLSHSGQRTKEQAQLEGLELLNRFSNTLDETVRQAKENVGVLDLHTAEGLPKGTVVNLRDLTTRRKHETK